MNEFSWPVMVLALSLLLAGAVVGDALRAAAGGGATQGGGMVVVAATHP